MPLVSGKDILETEIMASWSKTSQDQTPEKAAADFSAASLNFGLTGVPATIDTVTQAAGQVVSGYATTTPGTVSGTGLGGIDAPVPGMGLDAAKSILVQALVAVYSNTNQTPATAAKAVSLAVFNFLSQAKVMTNITATAVPGQAAPAPVGPLVPGPWAGLSTGSLESTSGAGLSSSKSSLQDAIAAVWKNNTETQTYETSAKELANALLEFYKKAKITATDLGTAGGGACVVDPLTGSGVTVAPSPGTGLGTGVIS